MINYFVSGLKRKNVQENLFNSTNVLNCLNCNKKSVLNEIYMCPQCAKTYKLKHSLLRHIKFECGIDPQYSCHHCGRKFKHKYDMNNHIKNIHPDVKVLCNKCNKFYNCNKNHFKYCTGKSK